MDFSPPGSSTHGDSPGKKSGLGCYALLQGIFQTQGLNPGHLHCRRILHHLRHQGSPLSPRVCSDLCPLSQWCYLTVSFSATFSLSLQCFPSSGSLPVSQLFTSGGQRIGVPASASVLPVNIQPFCDTTNVGNLISGSSNFSKPSLYIWKF